MLLVKIVKLCWHDHTELQSIVADLIKFGSLGERHLLISLTAMEELIVEMGYVQRGRHLHAHRRISCNFRDSKLFEVFKQSFDYVTNIIGSVLTTQAFQQI